MPAPTEAACQRWFALIRAEHRAKNPPDLDALARAGVAPLSGGRNNTIYRCDDGAQTCCVKLYRTDGRRRDEREWRALGFLAAQLPGFAPQPFSHSPDERLPLVAMGYLPGEPLLALPLDERRLQALASQLRRVAALTPAFGYFPDEGDGSSRAILARAERRVATVPPDLRPLLGRWLASDDPATLRRPAPPIFGLSDPNLANWLWDETSSTLRRVDLEYAGWSDLAGELASLIEGPWARDLPDATWLAFAGQFPELDPARFAAARRLFALFWVNIYAERDDARLPEQAARATTLLEDQ